VTAFTPSQLAERTITTQEDLQSAVPGLTIRSTNNSNDLNYSIRGQTVDAFSNSSPGVLPYFNDVQTNIGGPTMIYDMASLQVVKGPQGTLFGRNTTGGAVLFYSEAPTGRFGGYLTTRLGDYNLRETVAAVNLPVIDDELHVRIAGDTKRRDGYVTNLYDSAKLGQIVQDSMRASVFFAPMDGLENTTVFQYNDAGGSGTNGGVYSVYGPDGHTVYSVSQPAGYQWTVAPLNTSVGTFYTPAIGTAAWAAYVAAHPKVNPLGVISYLQAQAKNGPYTVDEEDPSFHDETDKLVTNTLQFNLSEHSHLKNIFGYVNSKTVDALDLDGTPYGIYTYVSPDGTGLGYDRKQYTDEQQWAGTALHDALNYTTGLYYASQTIDTTNYFGAFDLSPIAPTTEANRFFKSTDKQWAAYAQTTYDLSAITGVSGLKFNAGFRWTHDEYELARTRPGDSYYPTPDESTSASKPSWLVGLDYQLTDSLMLYAVQRGSWRTGGINGQAPPKLATAAEGGDVYLPETTTDVELGAKFRGDILGIPVTLNIDGYNQWVKNLQRVTYLTINGQLDTLNVNVPKAEVTGFEVDAVANLTRWLQVGVDAAETNARYTNGYVNFPTYNFSVDYNTLADTPEWTGDAYAQLHSTFEHFGEFLFRADVYAQSSSYFTNLGGNVNPGAQIPGYALINMRLELNHLRDTGASVRVFAKNVLNRTYYTGGLATGNSAGINIANVGEPRMFGVELSYQF
jgi:iron complex outermembrane receptor protein